MNAEQRERILAAARTLGPERFNLLVESVSQVHARGRLQFWQEELLARLTSEGSPAITNPADFIAVFEGVELLPVPRPNISQEEFLEDPNYHYYLAGAEIPEEWIALAWATVPEFRENVTYELDREASKNGDLELVQGHLEFLSRILPLSRLVELYEEVRQGSPHRELEFRSTFERIFGEQMTAFPPPLTKREIIAKLGEDLAEKLGVTDDDAYPD